MKTILIFSFFFLTLALNATIITVDNNYPSMGNFTTLQAAHDAAVNGDSILAFPSDYAYQAITVTKDLTFLGNGFRAQNGIKTARINGTMVFNLGSNNSELTGFDCYGRELSVVIDANNITIQRCFLRQITINANHLGTHLLQNFFDSDIYEGWTILVLQGNQITIENNLIKNTTYASIYTTSGCVKFEENVDGLVANNVINAGNVIGYDIGWIFAIWSANANYTVKNNIILSGKCEGNGNRYFNNMHSYSFLPGGNGNLTNVNMNTVFVNYQQDNYHLKTGSPALGSGFNNTDMGMYGGDFPFIDGGYPDLPAIYYINVPSKASKQGGVNVTIKAKSKN